jgi:hypothetical protein
MHGMEIRWPNGGSAVLYAINVVPYFVTNGGQQAGFPKVGV